MITFEINKKKYEVPEILTIGDYVKLYKYKDLFSEEYFAARIISVITGAPVEQLLESDFDKIDYIASYIISLIPKKEDIEFKPFFTIGDTEYGFFQNWRDLIFGEFMDLDTLSSKSPNEVLDQLHILAAIFYRPIKRDGKKIIREKYDSTSMLERAELFKKHLNCRYILGANFFFQEFEKRYGMLTQASLITKIPWKTKLILIWRLRSYLWMKLSKKRSDGSLSSTELLKTILQSTNMSWSVPSSKSLIKQHISLKNKEK